MWSSVIPPKMQTYGAHHHMPCTKGWKHTHVVMHTTTPSCFHHQDNDMQASGSHNDSAEFTDRVWACWARCPQTPTNSHKWVVSRYFPRKLISQFASRIFLLNNPGQLCTVHQSVQVKRPPARCRRPEAYKPDTFATAAPQIFNDRIAFLLCKILHQQSLRSRLKPHPPRHG